jgi:3-deoxy-D-arabino-heptulosonate 7-phosphate (DAHP) synthase
VRWNASARKPPEVNPRIIISLQELSCTIVVMAGPCAVESEDQLMRTGGSLERWSASCAVELTSPVHPRTHFKTLGIEGLKLLCQAREDRGLAIVTEVNYALLEALGGGPHKR